MLNNFRNLHSLFWSHGAQWLMFRVGYALRKRTGYIRKQMPRYQWDERPLGMWLKRNVPSTPSAYFEWRKQNSPKFFFNSVHAPEAPWDRQTAINEAERILSGELKYFSHTWYRIGFPPEWHKDPLTGIKLDSQKHWSEMSDDADFDIKFIWEPNRFGMVYNLVRAYAFSRDERFAAAFWELIQSWAESNPPNTGPNWMDGQEAAIRLTAWMFGYYQFFNSPSTTPERVAQFTVMVAAHAERIYRNIDYAISTHSNHTISEAFGLWMVGLLFPEQKDAQKYFDLGKRLLEQEAATQIFPDGTYSMYSLNYHRFILHLYLTAIRLGELNQSSRSIPVGPLSSLVLNRVSSSIDYLSHLIDPQTGQMPVYGSNDGALILPLNGCDFTDYRPLLQLGSYVTRKQLLFDPGAWDEDLFWFYNDQPLPPKPLSLNKKSFPQGGTYILGSTNSRAIIHCTDHRSRPSHADQLHVDLWMQSHNIAIDAGTYLYSGEQPWRNGLAHTAAHNTVVVDHHDQMKMLTRFTWTNWSHGKVLRHDGNLWQGEHDGYKRLADPVNHKRAVMALEGDRWLVVDHLTAAKQHHYALQWLLIDGEYAVRELASGNGLRLKPLDSLSSRAHELSNSKFSIQIGILNGNGNFSVVRADPNSTRGWRSRYYGEKGAAISAMLETDHVYATFWSFFGFEGDVVQEINGTLKINSQEIDLAALNK